MEGEVKLPRTKGKMGSSGVIRWRMEEQRRGFAQYTMLTMWEILKYGNEF